MKLFRFKRKKNNLSGYSFNKNEQADLIIYDDIYPHPISGFRLEEFSQLLLQIPNSKIIVNPKSYAVFNANELDHKKDVDNLIECHPKLKNKIQTKSQNHNINTKLFYCVFLNNIFEHLEVLEQFNIPFVFTLYPGGGFVVNDEETDLKLKKVLTSKCFRGVIVTQNFTYNYLSSKHWCDKSLLKLIFGCVVPQQSLLQNLEAKKDNLSEKIINICFCAAKYTKFGEDKGYDVFIEAVTALSQNHSNIKVHIIGGFTEETLDISKLKAPIVFYGYQKFNELSEIYKKVDIFVSPNKPFILYPGAFDGFPLGTAIEAALNGAVLILSDELNENQIFKKDEVIITKPTKENLHSHLEHLVKHPELLEKIAQNGREKFKQIYSNTYQIIPRINFLKAIINNE